MAASLLFRGRSERSLFLLTGERLGVVDLLHGIHAAVGLCEKALDVGAVLRAESHSDAQADEFAAADMTSGVDGRAIQAVCFFPGGFFCQPRAGDDEFIST